MGGVPSTVDLLKDPFGSTKDFLTDPLDVMPEKPPAVSSPEDEEGAMDESERRKRARDAALRRRQRAMGQRGFQSTILAGGMLGNVPLTGLTGKTVLGQ